MKSLFLSAALTVFAAAPAHAIEDYSALLMQMAACETNEECMIVEQACDGWTAINKRSEEGYNALLTQRRSLIECDGKKLPKPASAECVNNFCAVKE